MACSRVLLGFVLTSTAVLPAQAFHSSPQDHLVKEGAASSSNFGAYPSSRHMFFDGELRGNAGSLKEVTYRLDYRNHVVATEIGRSWSRVTLDVSDCNLKSLSRTFRNNPTSTPTRVFDAPISWRAPAGFPIVKPAPWGTLFGHLRFPFRSGWNHAGTKDLCLDFDFNGGVLDNKGPWAQTFARLYFLDGFVIPGSVAFGTSTTHGVSLTTGGCVDTNSGNKWGGYASLRSTTYSRSSPVLPGKVVLGVTTLASAASKPVIQALGVGGDIRGTPFAGLKCQRLFIDLSKPTVFITRIAPPPHGLVTYDTAPATYVPALGNLPIWLQAAWADSGNGRFLLTAASRAIVPKIPSAIFRSCLYQPLIGSKGQFGNGPTTAPQFNPICRYRM